MPLISPTLIYLSSRWAGCVYSTPCMGVEYTQPAHLLDRYIKGVILTVVDCNMVYC